MQWFLWKIFLGSLGYFSSNTKVRLSKFIQFQEQVGKEFRLLIKCLLTDNEGEYMSDEFLNY